MTHSLLQHSYDASQWQHHLDVRVALGRHASELLHGALLIDLVLFLHIATLLFPGRKFPRGYHASERESLLSTNCRAISGSHSQGLCPTNCCIACSLPSGSRLAIGSTDFRSPSNNRPRTY